MPVDNDIMLFSIINTFNKTLGVDICDDSKKYLKSNAKKFSKLGSIDKIYYTKYSGQIAQSLMDYLEKITLFEINTDPDNEIVHDFKVTWKKNNVAHISLSHASINTRDVIPEKLMKICGYKKNTNVCKAYTESYQKINDKGYGKVKSKTKYSEISDKSKEKAILEPTRNLVLATIGKKKKHSQKLYDHLFGETDRIVFRLYKNRYAMYDFGKELGTVEGYVKMKLDKDDNIVVTFNNKTNFSLCLQTNATEIKPHLSMKFKTTFTNMDELFIVASASV